MKLFLRNVSLFLATSFSCFLLLFAIVNYANTKQLGNFRVDPAIKSITVGDSHAQLAINDKLLPGNLNLSQRGDPFNYSLLKINLALMKPSSIRKIYLGVSYHNFSTYYDEYISGKYAAGIDARYLFILPVHEKIAVIKENISELTVLLRLSFINGLSNLRSNPKRLSFLGYYENIFVNTKASKKQIDKRLVDQYYDNGKSKDFSNINIYYLNEIVQVCKKRNIDLVILNTPLHPYYKRNIPQKFIDKYNSFIAQNHLNVIDLSNLALADSCYTADGDHVSEKGARLTTNRLSINESTQASTLVQR